MLSAEVFEFQVADRVQAPVLVVEVPPLFRVDFEALPDHGGVQDGAKMACFGGASGVVGEGAIGRLMRLSRLVAIQSKEVTKLVQPLSSWGNHFYSVERWM
jgi:hypothetical protein